MEVINSSSENIVADQQAIEYLQTIDFKSFGKSVFKDYLATVSETGKSIGELTVSVEETVVADELCFLVHAQSQGVIDDVPMGTSVTAYISRGVITLEQTQHEYIKIPNKALDKKTVLVRDGNNYTVKTTITEGDTVKEVENSFPVSDMKGFISEGANIILQRVMCLRQEVPENAKFIAIDSSLNLTYQSYKKLPDSALEVEGKSLSILGIQRDQRCINAPGVTWRTHFLSDGHMASRVTVGSLVHMQLTRIPIADGVEATEKKEVHQKDLNWEEDMQIHSHFLERKEELVADHRTYFNRKPELRALMGDFFQFILLRKPDDVCSFASGYFASFSSKPKEDNEVSKTLTN